MGIANGHGPQEEQLLDAILRGEEAELHELLAENHGVIDQPLLNGNTNLM